MELILTQEEADELLQLLKQCVKETINLPKAGTRQDYEAIAKNNKSERFVISVNRVNKRVKKVTFNARYKKGDVVLMRLDIAPTSTHVNPPELGGNKICSSHLHLYREGFDAKYAEPFDVDDTNICKAFEEFLIKFNVLKIPSIVEQLSLEGE